MHPALDIAVPIRVVQAAEDTRVSIQGTRNLVAQSSAATV